MDIHDIVPFAETHIFQYVFLRDTRVVDQPVDMVHQSEDFSSRSFNAAFISDVAAVTQRACLPGQCLGFFRMLQVRKGDNPAILRKTPHQRFTDA